MLRRVHVGHEFGNHLAFRLHGLCQDGDAVQLGYGF